MNADPKTITELRNQIAELEKTLNHTIAGASKRIEDLELQDRKTQDKLRRLEEQIRAMPGNMR